MTAPKASSSLNITFELLCRLAKRLRRVTLEAQTIAPNDVDQEGAKGLDNDKIPSLFIGNRNLRLGHVDIVAFSTWRSYCSLLLGRR